MKARKLKLQQSQYDQKLFQEIATTLQIENLRKCDNLKGTITLKNTRI